VGSTITEQLCSRSIGKCPEHHSGTSHVGTAQSPISV